MFYKSAVYIVQLGVGYVYKNDISSRINRQNIVYVAVEIFFPDAVLFNINLFKSVFIIMVKSGIYKGTSA